MKRHKNNYLLVLGLLTLVLQGPCNAETPPLPANPPPKTGEPQLRFRSRETPNATTPFLAQAYLVTPVYHYEWVYPGNPHYNYAQGPDPVYGPGHNNVQAFLVSTTLEELPGEIPLALQCFF